MELKEFDHWIWQLLIPRYPCSDTGVQVHDPDDAAAFEFCYVEIQEITMMAAIKVTETIS